MAKEKEILKEKMNQLQRVISSISWEDGKPEVTEELAYSIFGEDLSVENTDEELKEMFLFEL